MCSENSRRGGTGTEIKTTVNSKINDVKKKARDTKNTSSLDKSAIYTRFCISKPGPLPNIKYLLNEKRYFLQFQTAQNQ